jgi:predicted transport protein
VEDNEFIADKGLFLGQSDFNFSLPDSFETIVNYLKTVKEYRDYAHPDSPKWQEYIQEFFHILGFQTEQNAPRLISLCDMDANSSTKALVMLISPGENFEEIIPGLDWLSYLLFAANFYHVNWGILTNGLEMKIWNFRKQEYKSIYFWANLDGIIGDDRLDSFFTIYKIFSYIRERKGQVTPTLKAHKPTKKTVSSKYNLAYHTDNIPQSTFELFKELRTKILSLSSSITEKYNKMYVGYSADGNICEVRIQRNQLKIWADIEKQEISDPLNLCRDVSNIGHYGPGDIELSVSNAGEINDVLDIIKQAYQKHMVNLEDI